jgi:hypothetical protein
MLTAHPEQGNYEDCKCCWFRKNKCKKDVHATGAHILIIPQQSEIERIFAFRELVIFS